MRQSGTQNDQKLKLKLENSVLLLSPFQRVYFESSQNTFLGIFRGLNDINHKIKMVRVLTMPAEYTSSNVLKQLKHCALVIVSILKYS